MCIMLRTILVIEDERALREAIRLKLARHGFTVLLARSVHEARAHCHSADRLDAIWLDHFLLGGENGLDFVAELKKEEAAWRKVPVFVVSNTATAHKIKSYLALGIHKYYVKSDHKLEDIVSDIKKVVNKGGLK